MLLVAGGLTAATSVVGAVLFAAGVRWWAPLAGEIVHPSLLIVYVGLNVAVSVSVLADAYFIGRRRAALVCGRNAFAAVGKIAGLIVLAERGKPTGLAIFIAMVLPVAASMAIVIIPLRSVFREAPEGDERALVRQVIVFSLKNYVAALLDGAPTFLLPIIVLRLGRCNSQRIFLCRVEYCERHWPCVSGCRSGDVEGDRIHRRSKGGSTSGAADGAPGHWHRGGRVCRSSSAGVAHFWLGV